MKQREKCSGRGFDSRQVHHKHIDRALSSFDGGKQNDVTGTLVMCL